MKKEIRINRTEVAKVEIVLDGYTLEKVLREVDFQKKMISRK